MPRISGGKNYNNYKYLVKMGKDTGLFISQREISETYPELNRSLITNVLYHPDKIKNKKKFSITKLHHPLPVYQKSEFENQYGTTIILKKINYEILPDKIISLNI